MVPEGPTAEPETGAFMLEARASVPRIRLLAIPLPAGLTMLITLECLATRKDGPPSPCYHKHNHPIVLGQGPLGGLEGGSGTSWVT
jgi:hypothetical protein